MILKLQLLALLALLFSVRPEKAPDPFANIPDQIQVLNTNVTITPAGKEKIAEKAGTLTKNQQYYNQFLDRALAYFPVIEREFLAAGVPPDFKYLALQESTLDGNAVSKSNAVGYWQFKQPTAEEYQLRVANDVDERRNIIASSRAAAEYFKKSNHYLQNWVYALLSYNLGLTGARNYIQQNNLGSQVIVDANTHQYIVHFLAHYIAFNDAYRARQNAANVYLVEYAGGVNNNLAEIAQFVLGPQAGQPAELNSYVQQLSQYNPWLLQDRVPQNPAYCYSVVLPVSPQQRDAVISQLKPYACGGKVRGRNTREFYSDTLKNDYPFLIERKDLPETGSYKVILANGVEAVFIKKEMKTGKALKKLGVSAEDFQRFNDGGQWEKLTAGEFYYLAEKPETIPLSYHLAESGDSLGGLAKKYGIRLDKLLEYNELEAEYELQPGDKIRFGPVE